MFFFNYPMLIKRVELFVLRASGLGLISSLILDGRTDIQSVKLTSSIYIQSLNPVPYPLLRGIMKKTELTERGMIMMINTQELEYILVYL